MRRSFVPAVEQRDLRDLTRRRRRLLQEMSSEKNRVHKTLQDASVKLTSVVSNIFGVSGRARVLLAADDEDLGLAPGHGLFGGEEGEAAVEGGDLEIGVDFVRMPS